MFHVASWVWHLAELPAEELLVEPAKLCTIIDGYLEVYYGVGFLVQVGLLVLLLPLETSDACPFWP